MKKEGFYCANKGTAYDIFASVSSASELKKKLEYSAIFDEETHLDALTRYVISLKIGLSKAVSNIEGGTSRDFRIEAACEAITYSKVFDEDYYNEHYKNASPDYPLGCIVSKYANVLKDMLKKAKGKVIDETWESDEPEYDGSKNSRCVCHVTQSLEALVEETGDNVYQHIIDAFEYATSNIDENDYTRIVLRNAVNKMAEVLSAREMISYLSKNYAGIPDEYAAKWFEGLSYSKILHVIYRCNPYVFAALKKYNNKNKEFKTDDIGRCLQKSRSDANGKVEGIFFEKNEMDFE